MPAHLSVVHVVAMTVAAFAALGQTNGFLQPPLRSAALVAGTVIDAASGEAMEGVRVTRWLGAGGDATQFETITDSRGRFLFRDVSPGRWHLVAELPGYHTGAYGRRHANGPERLLDVAETDRITGVVIRLFRAGGVLAGTVTDETGEPFVGVVVVALRKIGEHTDGTPVFEVSPYSSRTDDRGWYRLSVLDGEYTVALPPATVISAPPSLVQAAVADSPGRRSGPPRVTVPPGPGVWTGTGLVFLGGDGAVPPPVSGSGGLAIAYPPVFNGGPTVAVSNGVVRTGLDLRAVPVPAVHLSGRVRKSDQPAGGVGIRLRAADTPFDVAQAISDSNGSFVLVGVPAGRYSIEIEEAIDNELWWARQNVEVGGAGTDGVQVDLIRGLSASGRVEFDGDTPNPTPDAVERMSVLLSAVAGPSWTLPATAVRADGAFRTSQHLPGRYIVLIRTIPGWVLASVRHRNIDVSAVPLELSMFDVDDLVVTVTNRVGQIAGRVASGAAQGRLSDAIVYLFPADYHDLGGRGSPYRKFRRVQVGVDGRYVIGSIIAGSYFIAAAMDLDAPVWTDVRVLEKLRSISVRVEIGPGETVTQALRARVVR